MTALDLARVRAIADPYRVTYRTDAGPQHTAALDWVDAVAAFQSSLHAPGRLAVHLVAEATWQASRAVT